MWTPLLAILSNRAGSQYQGAVRGFVGSSGTVASIMGLLIGGLMFDRIGGIVFVFSALILLLVFLLWFRCFDATTSGYEKSREDETSPASTWPQ